MSNTTRNRLITGERGVVASLAVAVVAVGVASVALGWAATFEWVGMRVMNVSVTDLVGVAALAMGLSVLGCGAASRFGFAETTPSDTAGVTTSAVFGVVGFVAGGALAAGVGLAGPVWAVVGVVVGILVAGVTVATREDVGSTLLPGVVAVGVGVALLAGVFGPEWSWHPQGFEATFGPRVAVPALSIFTGVFAGWAGAKASRGFGSRGRQVGAYFLLGLNAAAVLAVLVILIGFVLKNGFADVMAGFSVGPGLSVHWPFVFEGYELLPTETSGIFPAIVGTVWIVIGTVIIAVPLGVAAAIYLSEYAPEGAFTRTVDVATNALWSTPSVVFGLFGLAFLVPRLGNGHSLLAGIIVLSFMLLPLVLITSREALLAVPDEYRDASAALGVSRWETIKSVVLPSALPGVMTGTILGVGRIAGETAPLLLVTAGGLRDPAPNVLGSFEFTASPPFVTNDALLQTAPALPYQLYAGVTAGVSNDISNWGTALVLLAVVLSFYAVGIGLRAYFRRSLHE